MRQHAITTPFGLPGPCPELIGRTSAVQALTDALEQAGLGKGQILLLSGEAGIGKSRLVAEAKAYALQRGLQVVQGNCFEPDHALPYAPILDALRRWFASHTPEDLVDALEPPVGELLKLLPEFGPLFPTMALSPGLAAEQEQGRLFSAITLLFTRLAAASNAQGLLLVLEDVHWSDDTSLECLLHLARTVSTKRLCLLLTFRSHEGQAGLRHFLARLDRERLAVELSLERLSVSETEAMVRAIVGLTRPVPADFLHVFHALTEGTPFAIEEILRALTAVGAPDRSEGLWDSGSLAKIQIPRSVQDAVQRRAIQISPAARAILALAAVAGRRFEFDSLGELAGCDEHALVQILKELVAAQLVVEESADQFAFYHALTRQAIYAELLTRERKALHLRVAESIERRHVAAIDAYCGDLAYHFFEAGAWAKSLFYSQRAGEHALALFAPYAAVEHCSRAVDAAAHLAQAAPPSVYRARGHAYEILGAFEQALADYEVALRAVSAASDRLGEWQALTDLGLLWSGRDYTQAGGYIQRAAEVARQMNDAATFAHSLNRLGNWHLNLDRPQEGLDDHRKALAIFEEQGDRPGIAATLDFLGMASLLSGDLFGVANYCQRAMALFQELGNRQGECANLTVITTCGATYQTDTMVCPGPTLAELVRHGIRAMRLADAIGWRAGQAFTQISQATCLGPMGEYALALELTHKGLATAEEIDHRHWMTFGQVALGALKADMLSFVSARAHLEQALSLAQQFGTDHWVRVSSGFLASTCIELGELNRAEAVLAAALPNQTAAQTLGQRLAWCARVELALAQGKPDLALHILENLAQSAPNAGAEPTILRLAKLRGEALAALGHHEAAEAALYSAGQLALQQGARSTAWRVWAALSRLYATQDRAEDSNRASEAARALIHELWTNIPQPALQDGFRRGALALLPPVLRSAQLPSSSEPHGTLTEREWEVAALIALGKSNRIIADELVISERTVETHVSHIFRKLDFASRAEIAVWAVKTR